MPRGRPSRIDIAKADIVALFDNAELKVYWPNELAGILAQHRSDWRLTTVST